MQKSLLMAKSFVSHARTGAATRIVYLYSEWKISHREPVEEPHPHQLSQLQIVVLSAMSRILLNLQVLI